MRWIGLTGGIGSGKSTVGKILRDLGHPVVDADELARRAVAKGTPGLQSVIDHFGTSVLTPEGDLDRKALGRVVFADGEALKRLETLIHPLVQDLARQERLAYEAQGQDFAFYEIPLLYEKSLQDNFDTVVVVVSSREHQLNRVQARDGLDLEEITHRLNSQLPLSEKAERADFVVENNGSLSDLKFRVGELLEWVRAPQG